MRKLTVELDDQVAKQVAEAAASRGLTPEDVAAEAIADKFAPQRRPSFIAIGRSGHTDTARRHKELRELCSSPTPARLSAAPADPPSGSRAHHRTTTNAS